MNKAVRSDNENKSKSILFQKERRLEEVIMLRCNNMRAFYIETLRIFTCLERNPQVNRTARKTMLYFWFRGLQGLEHRGLFEAKELAQSDEYATKGFIGDYG